MVYDSWQFAVDIFVGCVAAISWIKIADYKWRRTLRCFMKAISVSILHIAVFQSPCLLPGRQTTADNLTECCGIVGLTEQATVTFESTN